MCLIFFLVWYIPLLVPPIQSCHLLRSLQLNIFCVADLCFLFSVVSFFNVPVHCPLSSSLCSGSALLLAFPFYWNFLLRFQRDHLLSADVFPVTIQTTTNLSSSSWNVALARLGRERGTKRESVFLFFFCCVCRDAYEMDLAFCAGVGRWWGWERRLSR